MERGEITGANPSPSNKNLKTMASSLSTKLKGNNELLQAISDIQNSIVADMTNLFEKKAESDSYINTKKVNIGSTMVHKNKADLTAESDISEDEDNAQNISHKASVSALRLNESLNSKTSWMLVNIPYKIMSLLDNILLTPNQSTIQWIDISVMSMEKYGDNFSA